MANQPKKPAAKAENRLPIIAVDTNATPNYPKLFLNLQEAYSYRDSLHPGLCPRIIFLSFQELDSMLRTGLKTMELLQEFISSARAVSYLLEKSGHIVNANTKPLPHRDFK